MYYDRWSDRNREAKKQGSRDAERGYRSNHHDYDSYSERGAAYDDGYQEERRRIERRREERQEQEQYEREVYHRQLEEARMRQQEEEDYYFEREQQEREREGEDEIRGA